MLKLKGGENVKKNMLKIMSLIALTFAFTVILSGAVSAAVTVDKVVSPGDANTNVGHSFDYIITVTNTGPTDPETGVTVTDVIPPELQFNNFNSVSQGIGVYTPGTHTAA